MVTKSLIFVAVLLVLVLGGVGGVYAYDSSNESKIAKGVTVAGIAVGGLPVDEARERVRTEVAAPLRRPVVVTHGARRFTLSAAAAGVRADVGGMVDEALRRSREGNFLGRGLRDLTGGEAEVRVARRVSYSKPAAAGLVERVSKAIDRRPKDATLNFPSLERVKEKPGVEVRADRLRADVQAAITRSDDRSVDVPTRVTQAKVTLSELEDKYPSLIVVDRGSFKLRFYKRLNLQKEYTIAVGQAGYDTPAGLYNIQNKAVDPAWSVPNSAWAGSLAGSVVPGGTAENPLKERWMGIAAGAGIHGTDDTASLGTAASRGCIRMAIPEVIELYDKVAVGTPIYVA